MNMCEISESLIQQGRNEGRAVAKSEIINILKFSKR